jgi:magnesium transporter
MSRKPQRKHKRKHSWVKHRPPVHVPPGTITVDPTAPKPSIQVIAYGPDKFLHQPITDLDDLRKYLHHYPVTWVNVDGLGDADTIRTIGEIFSLHRLALEDVAHVRQRPKADRFPDHIYIVARMIDRQNGRLGTEQLSMFLGRDFVITFQERPGDCLDVIRQRLRESAGRAREYGPDSLVSSILDAVVDEYFPVVETLGDCLEELEDDVLGNPGPALASSVHEIKRDLLVLRRAMWPQREALSVLERADTDLIKPGTRFYLRDCYDHTFQILDLIEVYRELSSGLTEMYMTSVSYRLNQVMKVLTIIATIFIPLTFIVGIYGMNFDPDSSPWNMPELRARYGYPIVMGIMGLIGADMMVYFWRKGWLRDDEKPREHESQSGDREK